MTKELITIPALVIIGALVAANYLNHAPKIRLDPESGAEIAGKEERVVRMQPDFYDKRNFEEAVRAASALEISDDIGLVVVPHHLLASGLIAKGLKMASGREVELVAVIGPNHENRGPYAVATGRADWETPFGILQNDAALTEKFISEHHIYDGAGIFTAEHSIGAVTPFIKYYFPKAKILPILLSSYASYSEASSLGTWLESNLPPNSLVVVSSDFSHYLSKQEADRKDALTRAMIENKEIERIARLGNDQLDCPAGMAMSLLFGKAKNLTMEIIDNLNSFDLQSEKPTYTTSYFLIILRQSGLQ